MAIFKVEKNEGYTVMSNHHLRNAALTLKAKGLLSQMLSLPAEWDYTLAGLSHINKESVDAIRTAVWELEKAGYVVRRQGRDKKGKMTAIEYTIYEHPQEKPETKQIQGESEHIHPLLENPTSAHPASGNPILENPISDSPTSAHPTSAHPTSENPTQLNKDIINTDILNIEKLNPSPSLFQRPGELNRIRMDGMDAVYTYRAIIKENIEYENLTACYDQREVDEIVDLMLEAVCTSRTTIRIAGDDYPAEFVRSKLLKLDNSHIDYVFGCLKNNTSKIRNIKKYLLAALFNASSTIENYYSALVRHDLYGKDA